MGGSFFNEAVRHALPEMTFRSPEDDTRPVGWNRGQEHRPRSWGGLCVAHPRNRKGERSSAQNRTTTADGGVLEGAASLGPRGLRASAAESCVPEHPAGCRPARPSTRASPQAARAFSQGAGWLPGGPVPRSQAEASSPVIGPGLRDVSCPPQSKVHPSSRKGDTDPASR